MPDEQIPGAGPAQGGGGGISQATVGAAATAEAEGTTYCCKWCDRTTKTIKKGYGTKPCDEWNDNRKAVKCTDADPSCEEGEDGENGNGEDRGDTIYVPESQQCPDGYEDGGIVDLPIDECKSDCRREFTACKREALKSKLPADLQRCQTEYQTCISNCAGGGTTKRRKCVKSEGGTTGDCPEGIGDTAYEGCKCGKQYTTMTGTCAAGYAYVPRTGTGWKGWKEGAKGRCECIKWCLAINCGQTCQECQGGTGGQSGEFKWSGGLSDALKSLLERLNLLLTQKRGTTEEERQGIINYASAGTKRAERGRLQSARDTLSRMGLLGSGFQVKEEEAVKRGTSENLANIRSQVAIDELNRRYQELMGTTGMAQSLAQLLMGSEQIPETLSAGRRAEGSGALDAFLRYLSTIMGSSQSGTSGMIPWLQALMNQSGGSSQGGGNNWMQWLMYLLGNQLQGGGLTQR